MKWEYINLDHSKCVWSTLLSGYAYSIILLLLRVLLHGLASSSLETSSYPNKPNRNFLLFVLASFPRIHLTCFSSFVGLFLSHMGPKQTLFVLLYCLLHGLNVLSGLVCLWSFLLGSKKIVVFDLCQHRHFSISYGLSFLFRPTIMELLLCCTQTVQLGYIASNWCPWHLVEVYILPSHLAPTPIENPTSCPTNDDPTSFSLNHLVD